MNGFNTMLKMNIKLLLRNKGYLVLLILLPVISVLMLNLNDSGALTGEENIYSIQELKNDSQKITNMTNTKLSIKVYDCSQSELSEYIMNELAKTGSYLIYRLKSNDMNMKEVRQKALVSANENVIGAVIYFPASFETEVLGGSKNNAVIFEATKDGRIKLLKNDFNTYLQSLYSFAEMTGYHKEELLSLLNTSVEKEAKKSIVNIEMGDSLNLSRQQQCSSSNIGLSLAFLTIGFLFSGVFIAATVVDERNNRVYNRILLSSTSLAYYGLVKIVLILMTDLIQTGIIAAAVRLLVNKDFGIPYASYLFLVFCLGLIFNLFSLVIGVVTNNTLTANYIAFLTWCLSCVLAGLYFPLNATSSWWSKISMLMPQRWVVKTSEMLMAGKSDAFSIYLLVFAGYIFIISSVGYMGLKIRKKD